MIFKGRQDHMLQGIRYVHLELALNEIEVKTEQRVTHPLQGCVAFAFRVFLELPRLNNHAQEVHNAGTQNAGQLQH